MAALLITQQILGQIIESLIPYLMYKKRKISITKEQKSAEVRSEDGIIDLKVNQDIHQQTQIEGSRDPFPVSVTLR
jgi:anoctamin-10